MKLSSKAYLLPSLVFAVSITNAQVPDFEEPKDNTSGLMLGAFAGFVPGFAVNGKDGDAGFRAAFGAAPSLGVQIGYSFHPSLAVFANVDRSDHDSEDSLTAGSYSLHHVEVGGRYLFHLPQREKIVAHANVAFGVRQLYTKRATNGTFTGRMIVTARELNFGGGVHYFFSQNFAVDGNAQFGFGSFQRATLPGERKRSIRTDEVVSARFRAGVVWYPFDY